MIDQVFPHQLLERYVADHLGRRADLFGPFADDLFIPIVRAVSDRVREWGQSIEPHTNLLRNRQSWSAVRHEAGGGAKGRGTA